VDVRFYRPNTVTWSGSGKNMKITSASAPAYEKKSLPAIDNYCVTDGGTYTVVVSVDGGNWATAAIGASIVAAAGAACVATDGDACEEALDLAGNAIQNLPPPAKIFYINNLGPGSAVDIGGTVFSPTHTAVMSSASAIYCNAGTKGFACKKDNGDAGTCSSIECIKN
jgi:hypothetical protein